MNILSHRDTNRGPKDIKIWGFNIKVIVVVCQLLR